LGDVGRHRDVLVGIAFQDVVTESIDPAEILLQVEPAPPAHPALDEAMVRVAVFKPQPAPFAQSGTPE
jgi:hypothetical protein